MRIRIAKIFYLKHEYQYSALTQNSAIDTVSVVSYQYQNVVCLLQLLNTYIFPNINVSIKWTMSTVCCLGECIHNILWGKHIMNKMVSKPHHTNWHSTSLLVLDYDGRCNLIFDFASTEIRTKTTEIRTTKVFKCYQIQASL